MSKNNLSTKDKILNSAREEFLEHGFAKASLRTISAKAGVTTGALYKNFIDKADLFDQLVSPCFNKFIEMYDTAAETFMNQLDDKGIDWTSSEQNLICWVEYMYENLQVFKLLLTAAEKTSYEDFVHMMVDMEVETTLQYMEAARSKGYEINKVGREELHLLVSAQFSVLFEMVLHNMPKEKALALTSKLYRFFEAGWREIFIQ